MNKSIWPELYGPIKGCGEPAFILRYGGSQCFHIKLWKQAGKGPRFQGRYVIQLLDPKSSALATWLKTFLFDGLWHHKQEGMNWRSRSLLQSKDVHVTLAMAALVKRSMLDPWSISTCFQLYWHLKELVLYLLQKVSGRIHMMSHTQTRTHDVDSRLFQLRKPTISIRGISIVG